MKIKSIMRVLLFLLGMASSVFACLCDSNGSETKQIKNLRKTSDVIFVGRVVKIEKIQASGFGFKVTLEVEKSWKGDQSIVDIYTRGGCAVYFTENKEFLVYARKNKLHELETNLCMRTGPLERSHLDLKKLGKARILFIKKT